MIASRRLINSASMGSGVEDIDGSPVTGCGV
jgi:hypothetical protein